MNPSLFPRRANGSRGAPATVAASAFLAALVACAACSLVVDTNASQCELDADCASRGEGALCVAGVCTFLPNEVSPVRTASAEAGDASGCISNALCDEGTVCDLPSGVCRPLVSEDCPFVIGSTTSASPAFVFGAVLPAWEGPAKTSLGVAAQQALSLAMDELNSNPRDPGLPGMGKIAMVMCADTEKQAVAARIAEHLYGKLGLSIVIGSSVPTTTRELFTRAEAAGAMVLSPTATDVLRLEQVHGAIVQMTPSDALQGIALARLIEEREPLLRAAAGGADLSMYVLTKDDVHGKAIAEALRGTLRVNNKTAAQNEGAGSYLASSYLNPANTPDRDVKAALATRTTLMGTAKPHVVVLAGTSEVLQVIGGLESALGSSSQKPTYFLTSHAMVADLADLVKSNESLRRRILGVAPGPKNTAGGSPWAAFQGRLATRESLAGAPTTGGGASSVAQYYDAVYAGAFMVVAAGGKRLDAASLMATLPLLENGGFPVLVGTDVSATDPHGRLNGVFSALRAGTGGAFQGASGVEGFDAAGRKGRTPVVTFCLPRGPNGAALPPVLAGRYLAAEGSPTLSGATSATLACGF